MPLKMVLYLKKDYYRFYMKLQGLRPFKNDKVLFGILILYALLCAYAYLNA